VSVDSNRYLQIRGRVEVITTARAREQIITLAGKYTGTAGCDSAWPGDVRVIYKIQPVTASGMG